jgi:hypothetical protein
VGLLDFEWVTVIRRSNRMEPWVGWLGRRLAARLDPSMRSSLSLEHEMRLLLATHRRGHRAQRRARRYQVFLSLPTLFLEEPNLLAFPS